ncbi:response regulator [Bradyrhizobium sp. UFLA05-112]
MCINQYTEGIMHFATEVDASRDRPTVFLIEREQVVRSALDYILRERYQTHAFSSVKEAMTCPITAPDAMLLGIAILRERGDAVLAELGNVFAHAKILLIAERNSDPVVRAGLERGAHGVIRKPISYDSVCSAVSIALGASVAPDKPSRLIRIAFDRSF